jgi:tetratricopeptide (TPR) repeat protein
VATDARRESARTRGEFGLALYRGGGIGSAVTQWQQALAEDSVQQLGVTFLIARGNYDLSRYQASLDVLKEVIRASADIPIRANAYSMAGDCYAKLGQDFDARRSYKLSLKEDNYTNFWGMSRLIGN